MHIIYVSIPMGHLDKNKIKLVKTKTETNLKAFIIWAAVVSLIYNCMYLYNLLQSNQDTSFNTGPISFYEWNCTMKLIFFLLVILTYNLAV